MLYEVRCLKLNEDVILALAGQFNCLINQVVAILKNALLRINLNIQRARGQCYDGAATKADEKTGVATQMENAYTRSVMDMPQIWLWLMP